MATDTKRRWQGGDGGDRGEPHKRPLRASKAAVAAAPGPTSNSLYAPMFTKFRNHMDAHQDRRERVVKASRDITALSKKIIFALQRVRRIHPQLPPDVDGEIRPRLAEVGRLLAAIAPEMQGINRGRYGRVLFGMEELVEALTFLAYLQHQTLLSPEGVAEQVAGLCEGGGGGSRLGKGGGDRESGDDGGKKEGARESGDSRISAQNPEAATAAPRPPTITPSDNDYLMGVFDLSGEMMRFATTMAALRGELAGADSDSDNTAAAAAGRTIVTDMHELGTMLEMLPQRHDKSWRTKMQVMRTSVQKVERLGYDLRVRGTERPKGWIPDAPEEPEPEGA